jgi:solute carrier family 25 protein 14/30
MAIKDWRPFIYGGLASCTAECGTFPIDTTKTRLQIQGQKSDLKNKDVKYRGMLHAIRRIYLEEGLSALYSGVVPAVLRQAVYGTIKIGIYHSLKSVLTGNANGEEQKLLPNVLCAVSAGAISATISNPTDVLKVRMQARCDSCNMKNVFQCVKHIINTEGFSVLYRGVGPAAQRAAIVVGVQLPTYDLSKETLKKYTRLGESMETHAL